MTCSRKRLSSQESGTGMVELAFCLPIFLLLILGAAEISNLAWASVQINNAAHAGAAYGSRSRTNATDTDDIQIAAQNEAPKFITDHPSQVTSTQACSCVGTMAPRVPSRAIRMLCPMRLPEHHRRLCSGQRQRTSPSAHPLSRLTRLVHRPRAGTVGVEQ